MVVRKPARRYGSASKAPCRDILRPTPGHIAPDRIRCIFGLSREPASLLEEPSGVTATALHAQLQLHE
jgi:hypothetical protein